MCGWLAGCLPACLAAVDPRFLQQRQHSSDSPFTGNAWAWGLAAVGGVVAAGHVSATVDGKSHDCTAGCFISSVRLCGLDPYRYIVLCLQVSLHFPGKDTPLMIGCSDGCTYSIDALEALEEAGYSCLVGLKG